jgi:hypothetical protein
MIRYIIPATLFIVLGACGSGRSEIKAKEGVVTSTLSNEPLSAEELLKIEEEEKQRKAVYESSLTNVEFNELYHDFGDVLPSSSNTFEFEITNTGTQPLIVDDASASCGCTVPVWPKEPIAPGASDVIEVTFSPKPSQKNEIKKTVTVTANTKEKVHKLEIRAFVKE